MGKSAKTAVQQTLSSLLNSESPDKGLFSYDLYCLHIVLPYT